ncbi:Kinesin-like protein kif19 [Rhizophlyctis rosea]|uniref:Kinesin-like protein kif19 n=1 Tax=Rhizophlyctis rosea TaxID=64517 RepID=A0AAD5SC10_9FUNG|nr:Kinesin-like protein kif19 [Rhizophlyctis rosea]
MSLRELAKDNVHVVARSLDDNTVQLVEPIDERYEDVLRKDRPHQRIYTFDCVFSEAASQIDVFNGMVKALVDWVVDGSNATVFAYGATGAGKTYTMLGTESNPGIMALTLIDLFTKVEERNKKSPPSDTKSKRRTSNNPERHYSVSLSYLEIYNENVRDLLSGKPDYLELREDARGVVVAGITNVGVESPEEVLTWLRRGNKCRTQEATGANEVSSRSHAVLQLKEKVTVTCKMLNKFGKIVERLGKLSMIDLAGSERAAETKNRGMRMVEGANINRSLLALGNCINALGDTSKRGKYVNYRDSKLTRLLKDSLGGNCRTVMIANISPSSSNFDETQNTLKYAYRARSIKTKIIYQSPNKKQETYHATIHQLQSEIGHLKHRLSKAISQHAVFKASVSAEPTESGLGKTVHTHRNSHDTHDDDEDLDVLSDLDDRNHHKDKTKMSVSRQLTYDTVPTPHPHPHHEPFPKSSSDTLFTSLHTTLSGLFAEHRAAADKFVETSELEQSNNLHLRKARKEWQNVRSGEDEGGGGGGVKEMQRLEGVVEEAEKRRKELAREKDEAGGKMKVVEEGIRSIQQSIPKTLDRRDRQYLELLVKLHFTEMDNLTQSASPASKSRPTPANQHNVTDLIELFTTIVDTQNTVLASHGIEAPPSLGKLYKQLEGTMGEVEVSGAEGKRKGKLSRVNEILAVHGSGKIAASRQDLLNRREEEEEERQAKAHRNDDERESKARRKDEAGRDSKEDRHRVEKRRVGEDAGKVKGREQEENRRREEAWTDRWNEGDKGGGKRGNEKGHSFPAGSKVKDDGKHSTDSRAEHHGPKGKTPSSKLDKHLDSDVESSADEYARTKRDITKKPIKKTDIVEPKSKKEEPDTWANARHADPRKPTVTKTSRNTPTTKPTFIPKRHFRDRDGEYLDERSMKLEMLPDHNERNEAMKADRKKPTAAGGERKQEGKKTKDRPAQEVIVEKHHTGSTPRTSPPPDKDPIFTHPARPTGHLTPTFPTTPAKSLRSPPTPTPQTQPTQQQPPPPPTSPPHSHHDPDLSSPPPHPQPTGTKLTEVASPPPSLPQPQPYQYRTITTTIESPVSDSGSYMTVDVTRVKKKKKRGFWKRITGRGGEEGL